MPNEDQLPDELIDALVASWVEMRDLGLLPGEDDGPLFLPHIAGHLWNAKMTAEQECAMEAMTRIAHPLLMAMHENASAAFGQDQIIVMIGDYNYDIEADVLMQAAA